MQLETRLIGSGLMRVDLVAGDLVISRTDAACVVALVCKTEADLLALVLKEIGKPSGRPTPRLAPLESEVDIVGPIRRIRSGLSIEPQTLTDEAVATFAAPQPWALAVGRGDPLGIVLSAANPEDPVIIDLRTGEAYSQMVVFYQPHWKLVWREGGDAIELYRSPK